MLTAGAAGAAVVLSRSTRGVGRTGALRLGSAVAAAGCVVVVGGGLAGLIVGNLLVGAGSAAVMLSRYAAAELGTSGARARSMASVMAMMSVGAVIGPNLLAPSAALGESIGAPGLRGAYLVSGAVFAVAGVLLEDRRSAPRSGQAAPGPGPTSVAAHSIPGSTARIAVAMLAVANLVMVGVMTMAPLQLRHGGTGLGMVGLMVSAHIAGMFAPAVLSGRLTERMGARRAGTLAMAMLVTACGWAAVAAANAMSLGSAMVLLGIGWNLAVVAGSDLLTATVPARERPRVEGLGELVMGLGAAVAGVGSGVVMGVAGYAALAWSGAVVPAALLVLMACGSRGLPRPGTRNDEPAAVQPARISRW